MEGQGLDQVLAWDDAGPVAILFFGVLALTLLSRWLFRTLIESKDSQIGRLEAMNDRLTNDLADTLTQILDALRERKQQP